jgi:flagellum-specific ATP synthase
MPGTTSDFVADCGELLDACRGFASSARPYAIRGRLTRASGLVMEAVGLRLPVGATCEIVQDGRVATEAEVVGFSGERLFLMPINDVHGLAPGAVVQPSPVSAPPPRFRDLTHPWRRTTDMGKRLPVGWRMLGRVVDASGRPLDGLGSFAADATAPLQSRPYNPIEREPVRRVLDVGVRAINGLLTVGRGQRIGIFAGSGVGKSVLLAMMARFTTAEVIVVGLIGERGREVKEFVEDILGADGLARSVVVAAPADLPPLMRMQGAAYATSIAEHFRNQGRHVLLIMDSLTRYAMAQREIALAINEPPATKGYPPSVFAKLPQLVERTGNGRAGGGSITAFYTVLTEGDDQQDPIADAARAILDGHFVLSRSLADAGHYPAIDIGASVSRVMPSIVSPEELAAARAFRTLYTTYERNRDLFPVGAYQPGQDPLLDRAVTLHPRLEAFLQQGMHERATVEDSRARLLASLESATAGAAP